jgi:hypothetical protein
MVSTARRRGRWPRRLVSVSVLLVTILLLASTVGARLVVAGSRGSFAVPASTIGNYHLDVTFPGRVDHIRLSGWLFRADHPSGRSVNLEHGWQGVTARTSTSSR